MCLEMYSPMMGRYTGIWQGSCIQRGELGAGDQKVQLPIQKINTVKDAICSQRY